MESMVESLEVSGTQCVTVAVRRMQLGTPDGKTLLDYLPEDEIIHAISERPTRQSVVVTGRGGGSALQSIMDTVSEVREVKHAFKAGIMARKGVDY